MALKSDDKYLFQENPNLDSLIIYQIVRAISSYFILIIFLRQDLQDSQDQQLYYRTGVQHKNFYSVAKTKIPNLVLILFPFWDMFFKLVF